MGYTLEQLNEKYDLELDKVISKIVDEKCKLVLLQFPDGLKPYATSIADYLEEKIKGVDFLIWSGSCFGACDTPDLGDVKVDLVVQFGHNSLMPGF